MFSIGSDNKGGDLELVDEGEPGEVDNWGTLDAHSRDVKIGESLKRLGNVRKKVISKDILKDMLGVDGDVSMVGEKEARENRIRKETRKLNVIYMSVVHFDRKMKRRMEQLKMNTEKSKTNTYARKELPLEGSV